MASTTPSLVSSFKTRIKDPNNRIFTSDANIVAFLNQAQLLHQSKSGFRWPENEGTSTPLVLASGTREYVLPTDFGALEMIVRGSQVIDPKDGLEFADVLRRNPNSDVGSPTHFYLRGANIGLEPIPSVAETATLYYRKRLPWLVNATSEVIGFAQEHDDAILTLMEYFAWSSLPDPSGKYQNLARSKLGLYEEQKLPTLKSTFLSRNPDGMYFVSTRHNRDSNPNPLALNRHR